MRFNLDDIPIKLTNVKNTQNSRNVVSGIFVFAGLINAIIWLYCHTVLHKVDFFLNVALTIMLLIVGVLIFTYMSFKRASTLIIDVQGVHVEKNGVSFIFMWSDISKVAISSEPHVNVNTGRTTSTDYLEIQRKGEYLHNKKMFLPKEDFGVGAHDLQNIIQDGVARWGIL